MCHSPIIDLATYGRFRPARLRTLCHKHLHNSKSHLRRCSNRNNHRINKQISALCQVVPRHALLLCRCASSGASRGDIPRQQAGNTKKGVEGNGRMLRVQYFFQFSSDEQPQTGKQRKLDKFIIVVQLVSKRKRWQSRKLHKWQTRPGLKNLRSLPSFRKPVPYWRLLSEARSPWMLSSSPLVERLC